MSFFYVNKSRKKQLGQQVYLLFRDASMTIPWYRLPVIISHRHRFHRSLSPFSPITFTGFTGYFHRFHRSLSPVSPGHFHRFHQSLLPVSPVFTDHRHRFHRPPASSVFTGRHHQRASHNIITILKV